MMGVVLDKVLEERSLGRYRLVELIGRGAIGEVYRGVLDGARGFQKSFAVKVLRGLPPERRDRALELLTHEAMVTAQLQHPNLVQVIELGEEGEELFVAMEWVPGTDLKSLKKRRGPPSPEALVGLALQVCSGLEHAHRQIRDGEPAPLVHCDLKPANLLVSPAGVCKVTDFGIARVPGSGDTLDGVVVGTPGYMPPEQLLGDSLGPGTDLYALAVVLYDWLVGRKPWPSSREDTPIRLARRIADRLAAPETRAPVESRMPGLWPLLESMLQPLVGEREDDAGTVATKLRNLVPEPIARLAFRAWVNGDEPSAVDVSLSLDESAQAIEVSVADVSMPEPEGDEDTLQFEGPTRPVMHAQEAEGIPVPWQGNAFVGRSAEVEQLSARLSAGDRLLTVLGPGGAGKTRLIQELGRAIDPTPPVRWCSLEDAREIGAIVRGLATTLGMPAPPGDDLGRLGAALRNRGEMIVVFDGVGGVVEALAPALTRLLAEAPQARFLVTSRRKLGLPGEQTLQLGPLPITEAASLFLARATEVRPGFTVANDDSQAFGELLERLDCLPLAIELAAARAGTLGVPQMLQRVDERFRLLRSGGTGRQATLKATIAWSWQQLAPVEQLALAQASVFRGDFDVEAAELVLDLSSFADAPWPVDALQALLDRSLLRRVQPVGETERFALYESIRDFATAALGNRGSVSLAGESLTGPDAAEAARRRHRVYYSGFANEGDLTALRTKQHPEHKERYRRDRLNYLQGTESGLEVGERDLAAACWLAAGEVAEMQGIAADTLDLGRRLVEGIGETPSRDEVRAQTLYAWLLWGGGFLEEAHRQASSAWERAQRRDPQLECRTIAVLSSIVRRRGDPQTALTLAKKGLALARKAKDEAAEARQQINIGVTLQSIGRHRDALPPLRAGLEYARQSGDQRLLSKAFGNIATVFAYLGQEEEAIRWYQGQVTLARQAGEWMSLGLGLVNLATVHKDLEHDDEARKTFAEALDVARGLGDRRTESLVGINWGELELDAGNLERAEALLVPGVQLGEGTWKVAAAAGRASLGWLRALQGNTEEAQDQLEKSILVLNQTRHREELIKALCRRGRLELMMGRPGWARVTLDEVVAQRYNLEQSTDKSVERAIETLRDSFDARPDESMLGD